jgi:hypothetical protein
MIMYLRKHKAQNYPCSLYILFRLFSKFRSLIQRVFDCLISVDSILEIEKEHFWSECR